MTNVQTRNTKLRARGLRILMAEAGIDENGQTSAWISPVEIFLWRL
jgi:N-acetylmuramic acid 6-phosphate (MurNAc-6-P) etherase